jgi:autotransporter-associated beta strand protein
VADAAISLGVALGGAVTIDVADASSSLTISSIVSGGGNLIKAGTGKLTLSGTNTYTGGTTLNDGTLVLGNNSALGAANGVLYLDGSNASLNLNGHCPTVGKVTLTDGSIVQGGDAATLTGSSYTVMKGAISANLAGNGGLTKITNDTVTLSGENTYSGVTTVAAGTLELGSSAQNCVFNLGGADIQGGKIVFGYAGGVSPATTVKSRLTGSYDGGLWDIGQFQSSTAAADGLTLGWFDDAGSAITIARTCAGDFNLDGSVNGDDHDIWFSNLGAGKTWQAGNANYDGSIDGDDYDTWMANVGSVAFSGGSVAGLPLSGADSVNEGAPYTLTLGEVTGVTAQSYIIDWSDGTSPQSYTEAQVNDLNRQVTHVFAKGVSSSIITVTLIDNKGLINYDLAGKYVAISTLAAPVSNAPVISNFYCINDFSDFWTLTGTVTDNDDPVEGDIVTIGGVLASYHLTATVGADGVFSVTVDGLPGLESGTGTAQTTDPHGVLSNIACYWIIV